MLERVPQSRDRDVVVVGELGVRVVEDGQVALEFLVELGLRDGDAVGAHMYL
jgi:hypothetical protein